MKKIEAIVRTFKLEDIKNALHSQGMLGMTVSEVFTGGAVEWTGTRMILTGSLTQSYSMKSDVTLDSMGVGRQNVNVSGAVAVPVSERMAAFVNVGRSLSPIEEGGTRLALSGGISVRFSAVTATP